MADEEDDVVFVNSPLFQHLSEVGFSDFDAQCHYDQSEQGTGNIAASTHTESNSDSRNSNHCQHWQDHAEAANGQPPRFTDPVMKISRSFVAWPANTPLSLKCNANGSRPLLVRWYKNGRTLEPSDIISQDSHLNLRLKNPQSSDSGIYTCVVSNPYGVVKHNYSLSILQRIQSAPVLVPGYPKPRTVLVGDSVQLECIEQQNGRVSDYRWLKWESTPSNKHDVDFKNGSFVVIDSAKYEPFSAVIGQRKLYGGRLNLEYVSEKDEGFYTCFVSNNLGYSHRTAYLNVTQVSLTAPPEFIVPKERRQQFVIGTEGMDVKMSCLIRGGSPLEYQWLFDGQPLKADERHVLRNAEMILKNVGTTDMGIYTCSISNNYGSIEHLFKLHVQRLRLSLPVLVPGYPKNKTGIVGGTASLFCAEIGSDNLMDYRWLKWHNQRRSYTTADLSNSSLYSDMNPKLYEISTKQASSRTMKGILLKLKNLTMQDQGLYTCFVSNSIGYSLRDAFLSVRPPLKSTLSPTTKLPEVSLTLYCYDYKGRDRGGPDHGKECQSRAPCGSIYNEQTDHWQMFCDETQLCQQYGINDGGCANVTVKGEKVNLCCCTHNLCNKPVSTLFVKSNTTTVQRSQLMTLIFLVALIVTFLIIFAVLVHRLRQRKSAGLTATIVHTIAPSRKSTKRIIMETKWLKEDV